ncbi:hypothetical protein [Ktedonobacter sp. SOSP1-85]|nr:hypothetical protein [Ktedonobacter sp. SOSP1-85]
MGQSAHLERKRKGDLSMPITQQKKALQDPRDMAKPKLVEP